MKLSFPLLVFLFTLSTSVFAQEDAKLNAKLQFSSMFVGTNNSFRTLKGELYSEDDNWSYYGSEYGLGEKAVTILQSKKDTTNCIATSNSVWKPTSSRFRLSSRVYLSC